MSKRTIIENYIGNRYGLLTVTGSAGFIEQGDKTKRPFVVCLCDCGANKTIRLKDLVEGKIISCGCYNLKKNISHGMRYSGEYSTWINMIQRCHNPEAVNYKYYGERGISVCEEWKNSFESFFKDMGKKPTPKHSIDRIEVNGNYQKDNCKWSTSKEQASNKRNSKN